MVGSKTSAIPQGKKTKHIPPSWVCFLHVWDQQLVMLALCSFSDKTLYAFSTHLQLYPWISAQKQGGSIRRMESACIVPRAWVFLALGKPVPCIPVGNFRVNWTLSLHLIWKIKDRNTRKMHVLSLWMWCSVVPAAWEQQLSCKHWATVSFLSSCACYISAIVVFPGESWKFQ